MKQAETIRNCTVGDRRAREARLLLRNRARTPVRSRFCNSVFGPPLSFLSAKGATQFASAFRAYRHRDVRIPTLTDTRFDCGSFGPEIKMNRAKKSEWVDRPLVVHPLSNTGCPLVRSKPCVRLENLSPTLIFNTDRVNQAETLFLSSFCAFYQ